MKVLLLILTGMLGFAISPLQAGLLVNPDFETGDLTGWTYFTTNGGDVNPPNVISFQTNVTTSLAAHFDVSKISSFYSFGGGGIYQDVVLGNGTVNLGVDWASTSTVGNADGGLFQLLLDGNVIDSFDVGAITTTPVRGTLSGSAIVTAGTHQVSVQITRSFTFTNTSAQYLDNFSISGDATTASPEPSTMVLTAGVMLAAFMRRRGGKN